MGAEFSWLWKSILNVVTFLPRYKRFSTIKQKKVCGFVASIFVCKSLSSKKHVHIKHKILICLKVCMYILAKYTFFSLGFYLEHNIQYTIYIKDGNTILILLNREFYPMLASTETTLHKSNVKPHFTHFNIN